MKNKKQDENPATDFHQAINRKDINRLEALMCDAHVMTDKAGQKLEGKAACLDAWRSFFAMFPDYHHEIKHVKRLDKGIWIYGFAYSRHPELHGPARWFARIENGKVWSWEIS
jgi:ketosteroid isomerase-like protein